MPLLHDLNDVMGQTELAKKARISKATMCRLLQRPDAPKPLQNRTINGYPVYSAKQVLAYRKAVAKEQRRHT